MHVCSSSWLLKLLVKWSVCNFIGSWHWQLHILRVVRWLVWVVDVRCTQIWHRKPKQESWGELNQATNRCCLCVDRTSSVEQVSNTQTWLWKFLSELLSVMFIVPSFLTFGIAGTLHKRISVFWRYLQQMSEPIFLDKSRIYELKLLMYEGWGGDHASLGMRKPSGDYERPIPGTRLFWTNPGNIEVF